LHNKKGQVHSTIGKQKHGRGMTTGDDHRAGKGSPDAAKARAMLNAFASVGVRFYDVTVTDIDSVHKVSFQSSRPGDEIAPTIGKVLEAATELQHNCIIRPRSAGPMLVQLDDLDTTKAGRVSPHAFMTLETSPGNYQAWVAVNDTPKDKNAAKDLASRIREGAGADLTASGATRIAGSLNFKTKYGPDFPLVELRQVEAGRTTTPAALHAAGLIAPEKPQPPRRKQEFHSSHGARGNRWPDYERCVAEGNPSASRPGMTRESIADFTWCRIAYEKFGRSVEDITEQLLQVSAKARDNGPRYALQTAARAVDSVERQPYRQKLSARPT
jgi:hypothetical protein